LLKGVGTLAVTAWGAAIAAAATVGG